MRVHRRARKVGSTVITVPRERARREDAMIKEREGRLMADPQPEKNCESGICCAFIDSYIGLLGRGHARLEDPCP